MQDADFMKKVKTATVNDTRGLTARRKANGVTEAEPVAVDWDELDAADEELAATLYQDSCWH